MKTSVYQLFELDCADCAAKLERRIAALPGVNKASLNFAASRLTIAHSSEPEKIEAAIIAAGARLQPATPNKLSTKNPYLLALAASLSISSAFILETAAFEAASRIAYLVAIICGGLPVLKKALISLKKRSLDSNVLMIIAVCGALSIDQWSEGAAVVVLFALGHALEHHTLDKTRRAIGDLFSLAPQKAIRLNDDGQQEEVAAVDIKPGESILIRPGQRIPLDGEVSAGTSDVDQAPITGESAPVEKEPGSPVFAGTLNHNGALTVLVKKPYQDSTLASIARLTEAAQNSKAPLQQSIDRFARRYTPFVIFAAILTAILPWAFGSADFSSSLYKALVLLVIACPCALVISTPVALVAALGNASRKGILIKGGASLEAFASIRNLAFDKTGTLTLGEFSIFKIISAGKKSANELLILAASLEAAAEHPIAKAIRKACPDCPAAQNFSTQPGLGASGEVDGKRYRIGSHRFLKDFFRSAAWEQEAARFAQGRTSVWLSDEKELLGAIVLEDTPRPEAKAALAELRRLLPGELALFTGDRSEAASLLGKKLELGEIHAGLLPEEKVAQLRRLQLKHGRTAMVGDGINDAPALAAADIGVAMGTGGSDAALAAADITLSGSDLSQLPRLLLLSRRTLRLIKQNIAFALFLKAAFIAATFSGHATLWMAVIADTGATLLVVANSMRLMR